MVNYLILISALLFAMNAPADSGGEHRPDDPAYRTVAERSDYKATARYADVVALLDRFAADSPRARRTTLGTTTEGREIPVILISDPPVATPEEAEKQVAAGKLFVFAIGDIHSGEVDGKEALPMVARELLFAEHQPLLRDLVIALAPIYNCDGNERVSKTNRPGQVGPEEGMGRRENAMGLDLNRDFIKLDAPETRGLVEFLNRWDPQLFIDTHTTNGSYHRYVITYEGPKSPAGDPRIVDYARDVFMPQIQQRCRREYALPAFVYGDFDTAHTRWETYPPYGRYGTTYVGLRNRLSVLSEGYSYAPYKTRVEGTRDFVKAILACAAENRQSIANLLRDADERAARAGARPADDDRIALRTRLSNDRPKAQAAGFVEEKRDGHIVSTGEPKDYEVELWTHFVASLSVRRPFAYILPQRDPSAGAVVEKLRQHGVRVERLARGGAIAVESYRIDDIKTAARPFQGHKLVELKVTPRDEPCDFAAGDYVIPLAQPLGNLIVYMLEPESEDGLATWGLLEKSLTQGQDFPICRVNSPVALEFR